MKLAFYVEHKGTYEALIRFFTGSPTHCEIVFSDDMWFSASNRDGGTRFKKIVPKLENWIYVDLPDIDEVKVRASCRAMDSRPYDFLGAIAGWSGVHSKTKWFCSEACLSAIRRGGFPKGIEPCRVAPHKLFQLGCDYATDYNNS